MVFFYLPANYLLLEKTISKRLILPIATCEAYSSFAVAVASLLLRRMEMKEFADVSVTFFFGGGGFGIYYLLLIIYNLAVPG
jgi:hypothetical protein